MDESDSVLTVMEAELPSIYNARRCLDVFKRMGYDQEKVLLVINRFDADPGGLGHGRHRPCKSQILLEGHRRAVTHNRSPADDDALPDKINLPAGVQMNSHQDGGILSG